MRRVLTGLALVLGFGISLAAAAQAASFDCAKATRKIEHQICNDPVLSVLDEQIAKAYRALPENNPFHGLLRSDQRDWLENDQRADAHVFEQRVKFLRQFVPIATCLASDATADICLQRADAALNDCMQAGSYSTYAMDTCSDAQAWVWDSFLGWATMRKRDALTGDPETLAVFDQAAAAFVRYRDADCGWQYSEFRDGTIRGQIFYGCYLDLTRRRTLSMLSAIETN